MFRNIQKKKNCLFVTRWNCKLFHCFRWTAPHLKGNGNLYYSGYYNSCCVASWVLVYNSERWKMLYFFFSLIHGHCHILSKKSTNNIEYFMESGCVRYLRTSCWLISERVRFLIQKQLVSEIFFTFLREKLDFMVFPRWMSSAKQLVKRGHCKLQVPIKSGDFGVKPTHLCGFWLNVLFFSHVKNIIRPSDWPEFICVWKFTS